MSVSIFSSKILFLIFGVFFFTLIAKIDFHAIPHIVMFHKYSETKIEYIYIGLSQIFGYIVTGFTLIIFSFVGSRNTLSISIIIFAISVLFLMISMTNDLLSVVLMIMSGSTFYYFIINIIYVTEYFKHRFSYGITLLFLTFAIGILCGKQLIFFFDTHDSSFLILLNVISLSLVLISIQFYKKNHCIIEEPEIIFSYLITNTKLQMMASFIVFYILASISWHYSAYDIEHDSIILDLWILRKYALLTMLIFAVPIQYLLSKFSKYLLNLLFLIILMISFTSLLSSYTEAIIHLLLLGIISICMYGLLISNLLILSDKFENSQLHTAIMLYFTTGAMGYYTGTAIGSRAFEIIGSSGLIASICIILTAYTLYYLLQFIRLKLYSW
ncbi:hypothetical protein [Candidatus Trichorickettsia mobilis]|uniref:hypothetical protein n=1 Tax=Candidatus Trichorickettsia mobilis TaxID=1346319 RepID=UPI00292E4E61|nr:hypothetical protein [Candidatus Trichorickettsia mobilis]